MDRKDGGTSFDPKTWLAPPPPSSAPETKKSDAENTSLDARSWQKDDPKERLEEPAPGLSPRLGGRPQWLIAGGSGVAILGLAAVVAYSARDAKPAAPKAVVSTIPAATNDSAPAAPPSRRTLLVSGPNEIAGALQAAGITAAESKAAASRAIASLGAAPGEVRLEFDLRELGATATLLALEATRSDGAGITLTRQADGAFAAETMAAKLTTQVRVVRGEMDGDSFYTSAVSAGVTDSLISDFANAFSFDFNFATDVKPGDIFEAAFEQAYNPSGQPVGVPKLLYVSFTTAAKSRALYRFLTPGEAEPKWFDGNGNSTVRALMLTPVDGARISSKFGPRFHPVLHFIKIHKGTDFAAPTGTPIYASGNATVTWAAMKGANGNLTILQHDNGWQTYYLHQSMFMPGIVPGARVHQGQKIGEIGTTGRSTGPHLHYEVHIDGQPVDPMGIPTGTSKPLSGGALAAFDKERDRIDRARAGAAT